MNDLLINRPARDRHTSIANRGLNTSTSLIDNPGPSEYCMAYAAKLARSLCCSIGVKNCHLHFRNNVVNLSSFLILSRIACIAYAGCCRRRHGVVRLRVYARNHQTRGDLNGKCDTRHPFGQWTSQSSVCGRRTPPNHQHAAGASLRAPRRRRLSGAVF